MASSINADVGSHKDGTLNLSSVTKANQLQKGEPAMGQARPTRRELNLRVDSAQLYKPFVFYGVVLSALHAAVVMRGLPSGLSIIGLLSIGLLSWGLYEYSVHRWVLHRKPGPEGFNLPGNLTHLRHHEQPHSLDRLNVQLRESIPVCVGYCIIAWVITGSWISMTYLYTGLMLGYFFYEYLDFQAHHGMSRGRLTRYFRKYHLQHHHYNAEVRFGVTSPLFDYIFGTFHLVKAKSQNRNLSSGKL